MDGLARARGKLDGLGEVMSVLEAKKRDGLLPSSDDIKGIVRFFIALARDDVEDINCIAGTEESRELMLEREHYLGYVEGLEALLYRLERLEGNPDLEKCLKIIHGLQNEIKKNHISKRR